MGMGKLNPGCVCCDVDGCLRSEDAFDRSDSTTIGGNWNEDVGDWDIVSEELHIDSSNAAIYDSTGPSTDCVSARVRGKLKGDDNGDELRLYLDYLNGSFIELTVGASATIRFVDLVGGDQTCSVTAAAGEFHTVEFTCCNIVSGASGESVWKIKLNGSVVMFGLYDASLTGSPMTDEPGFGTGTITSDAYFDDYHWSDYSSPETGDCQDDAEENTCPQCESCHWPSEIAPVTIDVELSGIVADPCGECTNLNAVYTLSSVTPDTGYCLQYEIDGLGLLTGCADDIDKIVAQFPSDTGQGWKVTLYDSGDSVQSDPFNSNYPDNMVCYPDWELVDNSGDLGIVASECDAFSATVTIGPS